MKNDAIVATRLRPRHAPSTLARLLGESLREHAACAAILAPGRSTLTYGPLGSQIETTARVLAEAGYGRGSRIAIALPDGPEFAVAVLAVTCAATCAPLNQKLEEDVLARLLGAMRIDALLCDEADSAAVRAARTLSIPLLRLHSVQRACAGAFELMIEQRCSPVPVEPVSPDDIALLGHTSGTTSTPKVVPFEHWRLAEAARNRVVLGGLSAADRCLLLMPLYSLGAIRRSLLPPLLVGGSVICPEAVDGKTLVDILEKMAPTHFVASPSIHSAVVDEIARRNPRPAHCLRFVYSTNAELPAGLQQRMEEAFGVPVIVSYGMTETGNIAQTPLQPERVPDGSVGRAANQDVAVADEDGRLLGCGETGEILVRGPEVFSGYEGNAEANRLAFRDGWFRTGDTGRIDRDGFIYLIGRVRDIINRGGAKIAPRDVEAVLLQHPAVREAAAFAAPHPTLGEDVAAAVVLRDGANAFDGELRRFARSRLPAFKVPAQIRVVDRLPRGALEKIDRTELAALAQRPGPAACETPLDPEEREVARIFAEVLGVPAVGRQDSFFAIGGDSLRGVRVLTRVEEVFGVSVMLDLLFDEPTVAGFAAEIGRLLRDGQADAALAADGQSGEEA